MSYNDDRTKHNRDTLTDKYLLYTSICTNK